MVKKKTKRTFIRLDIVVKLNTRLQGLQSKGNGERGCFDLTCFIGCMLKISINRLRLIIGYIHFVDLGVAYRLARNIRTCREVGCEKSFYSDHSQRRL